MNTSFFKIEGTELNGRLSEDESWSILSDDLAGPFIGNAVTKRTRDSLSIDAKSALLIEKNSDHPQHSDYWSLVNNLTSEAITELEECLRSLEAQ